MSTLNPEQSRQLAIVDDPEHSVRRVVLGPGLLKLLARRTDSSLHRALDNSVVGALTLCVEQASVKYDGGAGGKPCLRPISLIGIPASACLRNPIICSSLDLLVLISIILRVDGLLGKIDGTVYGGQVTVVAAAAGRRLFQRG